jgi:hypothetical protein
MMETNFGILIDLHVFSLLDYENVVFGILSLYIYVWMYALLALERLDRFNSYSPFNNLFILGHCPVDLNIPAPETRDLQIGPKT